MRKVLFLFFISITFLANSQDTLLVQDLKYGWLGMTKDGKAKPLMDPSKEEVIFFRIPAANNPESHLRLASDDPVDIWFEGQLLFHNLDSTIYLDADTLTNRMIKVFAKNGIPGSFETHLVSFSSRELVTDPIMQKEESFEDELYLVIATLILLLIGFFRRYFPITFNQSFKNPLSYKIRSISVDENYVTFGSVENLFSLFFFSCLISFLITGLKTDFQVIETVSFFYYVLNWFITSLLIALLILSKYLVAKVVASLYQIRELPNIQNQDFLHFFTWVSTFTAILTFINGFVRDEPSDFIGGAVLFILVASIIFFQIWIFLKIDKFYTVRKLMIISYLCTTEFLPGFLAVYWLMKV